MAQRIFHLKVVWLTKGANRFMLIYLTLVPEQMKELEIDLVVENFLKDYERSSGFKANFEFKTRMFHQ